MLRLFAHSPNQACESLWRQVAERVRRAELFTGDDLGFCVDGTIDCEAVVIARSSMPRPAVVERLLAAGKHVLLLDHPAWLPGDTDSLLPAAQQAGVQLAVVNSDRYQPSRALVKQQIADHLGPVGLLCSYRWETATAECPPTIAGLPTGLVDDLDLALWLCNQPIERVYAVEHQLHDSAEPSGRYLQVHLGFTPGMALIDYTNRLPLGDPYQLLSVIGFSGAAYAEDEHNVQLAYGASQPRALPTAAQPILAWTAIVQEFVDSLAAGDDLSHSVTAWRQTFALADAVNRSLAAGQAISWEGC